MKILEEAVPEPPQTTDPVVLAVDDDPAVLKALRRCFRHEAFDLVTARSGDEALSWLVEFPVDLLIADQKMPDMCGTELLRLVHRQFPETSCAILTAYRTPNLVEQSRDAGAEAVLYKPWDDDQLRNTIRDLLSKRPRNGSPYPDRSEEPF